MSMSKPCCPQRPSPRVDRLQAISYVQDPFCMGKLPGIWIRTSMLHLSQERSSQQIWQFIKQLQGLRPASVRENFQYGDQVGTSFRTFKNASVI
jgi:hypothetical protein